MHIATYPPAWPFHHPGSGVQNYNLSEAIRIRSAAHAFEGKVFSVVAACAFDADAIEQISQGDSNMRSAGGERGMVVADIDIARSIEQMAHDIVGYYNRFDIFHLHIDPTPNRPVWINKPTRSGRRPIGRTTRQSRKKGFH